MTDKDARTIMSAALTRVDPIPEGRTDIKVLVFGVRIYNNFGTVSVQFIHEGKGYSCNVGPKTGNLGKVSHFTP